MAWKRIAWSGRQRGIVLGGLLTVTLTAVAWVSQQAEDAPLVVAAPMKQTSAAKTAADASHVALEKLQRVREGEDKPAVEDVFQAKSWYVPPPPPKPVPPPPPAPPPLPFIYMGKLLEEDKLTVFLTKQDRHYAVKAGDTLDGAYRVESVNAQQMILTYLPLNMQQTLTLGGAN
ncbi:MAG: hypothetical protein HZA59_03190 [Hydrogenophilales bacterium]|nr:hypothetical protein [Hydrogenophilales bacterium]